jgi:hypothetical protein
VNRSCSEGSRYLCSVKGRLIQELLWLLDGEASLNGSFLISAAAIPWYPLLRGADIASAAVKVKHREWQIEETTKASSPRVCHVVT